MYYFNAISQLEEFKEYILSNIGNEIYFGNMEYYYVLNGSYLKIYEVDLDEFDIPTPIWKGCFGCDISSVVEGWKKM
jgi:hypothetical protein